MKGLSVFKIYLFLCVSFCVTYVCLVPWEVVSLHVGPEKGTWVVYGEEVGQWCPLPPSAPPPSPVKVRSWLRTCCRTHFRGRGSGFGGHPLAGQWYLVFHARWVGRGCLHPEKTSHYCPSLYVSHLHGLVSKPNDHVFWNGRWGAWQAFRGAGCVAEM